MNEVDDTGVPPPLPASDEVQDNIRDDIHERISQEDVDEESEALGETQEEEEECLEVEESCEGEEEEKVYGGCEGPDAMYVKLISSDGHVFVVKKKLATISGTVKAMLSGPGQFKENETNEVNFREIPSHVLQKVCLYFAYKTRYTNSPTEIPEFPIAPELALELLMAANFLDC